MTPKSKRLAWELLALLSKYSENDILGASELIASGEMMSQPLKVLRSAIPQKIAPTGDRMLSEIQRLGQLIDDQDVSDGDALREFAEGVATSQYLRSPGSVRAFGDMLQIVFPKRLPGRIALASRFMRRLLAMDHKERVSVVELGRSLDDGKSTLKAWSNLIVR